MLLVLTVSGPDSVCSRSGDFGTPSWFSRTESLASSAALSRALNLSSNCLASAVGFLTSMFTLGISSSSVGVVVNVFDGPVGSIARSELNGSKNIGPFSDSFTKILPLAGVTTGGGGGGDWSIRFATGVLCVLSLEFVTLLHTSLCQNCLIKARNPTVWYKAGEVPDLRVKKIVGDPKEALTVSLAAVEAPTSLG